MKFDFIQSPNYYNANNPKRIKAIVYHHTAGSFTSAKNWFKNPAAKASAHLIVRKDGYVLQMVKFEDVAWHAGVSFSYLLPVKSKVAQIVRDNWGVNVNSYTIGIEIEGTGAPFTDAQYNSLAEVSRYLCNTYKIPVDRYHLVGHYETNPKGKPTDPTEMDWNRLINMIKKTPMEKLTYDLVKKGNDLYMHILTGSIKETITVKNLAKKTQWTVYCDKAVGRDGGPIAIGLEDAIYEIVTSAGSKQFNNTSTPADPCSLVKNELDEAKKAIAMKEVELNNTSEKLRISEAEKSNLTNELENAVSTISTKNAVIDNKDKSIKEKDVEIALLNRRIEDLNKEVATWQKIKIFFKSILDKIKDKFTKTN